MGRTRCTGEHAVTQIPRYNRAVRHTCLQRAINARRFSFSVLLLQFFFLGSGNCGKAGGSKTVRGHLRQETGPMKGKRID